MKKRETPFLLCEAICEAVRQRLPRALSAESTFYFDYQGDMPVTTAEPATVHAIVDRLLKFSLRTSREGVFFRATVQPPQLERCLVQLRLASVNAAEEIDVASPTTQPADAALVDGDLSVVRVLCGVLGGRLKVQDESGGLLVEAEFSVPVLEPVLSQRQVHADGASVWLISSPPFAMKMLAARFRRLGWKVRIFSSVAEVEAGLILAGTVPVLVVGSGHRGVTTEEASRLRAQLPHESRLILQILQHMTLGSVPGAGVETHAVPLSPRRLLHLTEAARRLGRAATGNTQAGTLESTMPGTVLIVDDNKLNRIVCEEMVRLLGYRTAAVESGEAAIESCLRESPGAVLMDLHMPGMDGLSAATELRKHQAAGRMGSFPIWLVSADRTFSSAKLATSPFDGAIPKPIRFPTLKAALGSLKT